MPIDLTPEYLREALTYDANTGLLFWNERPLAHFPNKRACSAWNARYAHRQAFTTMFRGYRTGAVGGRTLRSHRVAWAIHYGAWPSLNIDHINGSRSDNRIVNLRDVSVAENSRNMWAKKGSRVLPTGVHIDPRAKKHPYYVAIKVDGKQRRLGAFATVEAANTAYRNAAMQHGFSLRHGERAR